MSSRSPNQAVIPVKGLRTGKSRLGAALSEQRRYWLNRQQFADTLRAAVEVFGAANCTVTSGCGEVRKMCLDARVQFIKEHEPCELNRALTQAREVLVAQGSQTITVIPVDLLNISAAALQDVICRNACAPCFIVPDRDMKGTNVFRFPARLAFGFQYGENSFSHHVVTMIRAGVQPHVYVNSVLNDDLDLPAQLAGLSDCLCDVPVQKPSESRLTFPALPRFDLA